MPGNFSSKKVTAIESKTREAMNKHQVEERVKFFVQEASQGMAVSFEVALEAKSSALFEAAIKAVKLPNAVSSQLEW